MRIFILLLLLICGNCFEAMVLAQDAKVSDDELLKFVRDTLDANPGVKSAQSALDAAIAQERADSQPLYNPELELEADDIAGESGSVGISQAIDWSNKRGARGEIAYYEREAIAAQLHQVRQQLAIELLTGIARFDVAQLLMKLADERHELMQKFADLAAQRREAGDLNQVELDLARLALADAQLQKSGIIFRLTESRQLLETVVGDGGVPATLSLPETPFNSDATQPNVDDLLNNLPAIRVQTARLAAASRRVKLRALEKRPDPTLGVRVGQEESEFIAGLSVSIPLYLRNNFSAEVDVASAERMQIEMEAQDIYRRTRARLLANLEKYRITDQAWQTWSQIGQESLGNQLSVLERLWRAGEIDTTDYLVQINQTLDIRVSALELKEQLWLSWFEWLAASGQIDTWLGISASP